MVPSSSSLESSKMWLQNALQKAQLNYTFSSEQQDRILQFFHLRTEWNQVHNLTGPKASLLKSTDLIDSVVVSLCMDSSTPLIDIGTGSGVPGLLVACLHPDHSIYLIEPSAKRCAFLKTALFHLNLKNVHVHRTRWPCFDLSHLSTIQLISRAVVAPEDWPLLAIRRPSIKGKAKNKKDVSQFPQVSHLMQMLAFNRPTWPLDEYQCSQEIHYFDPEGGERCVRRWSLKS